MQSKVAACSSGALVLVLISWPFLLLLAGIALGMNR